MNALRPETRSPSPRGVLVAYGQKRATQDQVMRALMLHPDWFAPIESLGSRAASVSRTVALSPNNESPAGELWLFTDGEAAQRAVDAGSAPGMYASGLTANEVFGDIDPRYDIIKINPGGPLDESWFVPREAFLQARIWSEAIAIETALAAGDPTHQPALLGLLARFEGYLTLVQAADATIVGLANRAGYQNSAVVFTSGDSFDRFVASLEPALRSVLKPASGTGVALLEEFRSQGFDSIEFNPVGPGTNLVVPISLVADVARIQS